MQSRSESGMDSSRRAEPRRKVSSRHGTGRASEGKRSPYGKRPSGGEPVSANVSHRAFRNVGADRPDRPAKKLPDGVCPIYKKCGGCDYQGMEYAEQLRKKESHIRFLLKDHVEKIRPIIGMKDPLHYRCKVHAAFDHDRKGNPVSGIYEKNSHVVVPNDFCMIEDRKADAIIVSIRNLLRSFRIRTYDEDTGYGLLRHVLVRKGYATGEYLVVIVVASPIFPGKNNFVKALRKEHPEITSIVLNINDQNTSMVLGERNVTIYGPGFIMDELCGHLFRISPNSFYQVNPAQTEILYRKALEYAELTGKEEVLDAYCGTGTIGIIASDKAGHVTGVELNKDAVRDAISNAKAGRIKNIDFICDDAGNYLNSLAGLAELQESRGGGKSRRGEKLSSGDVRLPDVIIMDPPRTGSTPAFIKAAAFSGAKRIVYVSCGPDTLARDLELFEELGYEAEEAQPVDLFPYTRHCECVVKLRRFG